MDPEATSKRSVPVWLNSSLWSSSRAAVATTPSPSAKQPSSPSDSHQQEKPSSISSAHIFPPPTHPVKAPPALAAADPFEPQVPEASDSNTSDTPSTGGVGRDIKESNGKLESEPKLDESEELSSEVIKVEGGIHGPLDEDNAFLRSQGTVQGTVHHDSSRLLPDADEESLDLFNTEGPMPSPLTSTPSVTSLFVGHSVTRSSSFDSRVSLFNNELAKKVISIGELQRLASQGIPDSGSIRALTWKLLLGYVPKNRDLWSTELEKKRAEYCAFKEELLVTPSEITMRNEDEALNISEKESQGPLPRHDITEDDHPLSLGKSSIWHQFFLDSEVCEQIDRDVKRTHPDMHFFCGDSEASVKNQEAMKRVLFIFSKLNPGIRYVQGMNEVLAPLYYVLKTDTNETNLAHAEADSFFCFVSLLGDFRDNFVQQLDNSAVGIRSTIARLNELLKRHDEELWRHLEHTSKVNPQFYAFRWITLLLTQEFTFPDCLRLWDSLLSNPEGPLEILLRICCAMLMSVRSRLLAGDFTSNLKLLQRYPPIDVHHLLRMADELKARLYV